MRKYLIFVVALSGCNCDTVEPLHQLPVCEANPDAPGCKPAIVDAGEPKVDAGIPPKIDAGQPVDAGPCGTGTVTGQICAPDTTTFVSGATVTVTGTCEGVPFTDTATTDAMGNFTFTVPAGTWTLTASTGSFNQQFPITVTAGETTTESGDMQYCFAPTVPMAVITGSGDNIEYLLSSTPATSTTPAMPGLGFTPTLYDGTETGFNNPSTASPPGGLQFLMDPTQLAKYKVIFIDCGAGRTEETYPDGGKSYPLFFFGSNASTIATNLTNFVTNGGSIYASDWAFIFIYLTAGQQFQWKTTAGITSPGSIAYPYDTYDLLGFQGQNPNGNVVDTGLAAYLGGGGAPMTTVPITFPSGMSHWGLLDAVNMPATPLITASVEQCATGSCKDGGSSSDVPLAAIYQVTSGPGGVIAYTSFHNIGQTNPAVIENILKYIVFKL